MYSITIPWPTAMNLQYYFILIKNHPNLADQVGYINNAVQWTSELVSGWGCGNGLAALPYTE